MLDTALLDEVLTVTNDEALGMARRLARERGMCPPTCSHERTTDDRYVSFVPVQRATSIIASSVPR